MLRFHFRQGWNHSRAIRMQRKTIAKVIPTPNLMTVLSEMVTLLWGVSLASFSAQSDFAASPSRGWSGMNIVPMYI
ncbi:hypothetical protein BDW69DRAFT_159283 [Aspergillus filifer]